MGYWYQHPYMPEYDKFNLRFPEGMREQLEAAAAKKNNSLHKEVVDRLRASLAVLPIDERVAALEREVAALKKRKA